MVENSTLINPQIDDVSKSASERGAAMVEYALLVALIAAIALGAVTLFGQTVVAEFDGANETIDAHLPEGITGE